MTSPSPTMPAIQSLLRDAVATSAQRSERVQRVLLADLLAMAFSTLRRPAAF